MANTIQRDGVILFAKRTGATSFVSLGAIKRALGTRKVGHTGTLDSFASGLLVVCCGRLTRLAPYITEFDKTYDAVIEFGSETDTLEWTGRVIKNTPLPQKAAVENALSQFTGALMQTPPLFSALHINGKRASDIARSGRVAEIPVRKVTIFSSQAEEFLLDAGGAVKALRARFSVSKGTYIRSLARDIGNACTSAAHLAGLRRISVGGFSLSDAAGFHLLEEFTISNVYAEIARQCADAKIAKPHENAERLDFANAQSGTDRQNGATHTAHDCAKQQENSATHDFIDERGATRQKQTRIACADGDAALQDEIRVVLRPMTETLARDCGFSILHTLPLREADFLHGRPLERKMFAERNAHRERASEAARFNKIAGGADAHDATQKIAVFAKSGDFLGIVEERDCAYRYLFVNGA